MQPATRKVVHRSPAHTVRLLNLPHLQDEAIEADSSVERDFVHCAALFTLTRAIKAQPFKLSLKASSYWAAAGLVDTDLSFLSLLELYGTEISERRMPTRRVVEALDVVEHI